MSDPLSDWPKSRLLAIVTLARRFGVFENELLAGTGCTLTEISDLETRQPVEVEFGAIRNLERLVCPDEPLGYYAGLDYHVRSSCLLQQALHTSARFGEALALATRYIDLRVSLLRVEMHRQDADLNLVYRADHLPEDVRSFSVVRSLVSSSVTARDLLGRPLPLTAVHIALPRPVWADVLDEYAGLAIGWEAETTRATCDARWADHPLATADAEVHAQATQDWQRLLNRYQMRNGMSAKLREQLIADGVATANLAESAAAMGFSARTLRRHLAAEGTSYRQILDETRLDQATQHLLIGVSIEETARRAGYAQASAFAQAFRRWTGTSPDAWRHSMSRGRQTRISG